MNNDVIHSLACTIVNYMQNMFHETWLKFLLTYVVIKGNEFNDFQNHLL